MEVRWPARQAGRRGGQGWGPWLLRLLSSRPFDTASSAYLNMRGRSVQQRGRGCVPQVFVVPPAWGQGLRGDSESAGAEPRCDCPPYPSGWAGRFPFPHLTFLISEMVIRRQWYRALGTAVSAVFSRASSLLITRRGEWRVNGGL